MNPAKLRAPAVAFLALALSGRLAAQIQPVTSFAGSCPQPAIVSRIDQGGALYYCVVGSNPVVWVSVPLPQAANLGAPITNAIANAKLSPYIAAPAAPPASGGNCCLANGVTQEWSLGYGVMWRAKWPGTVDRVRFAWNPAAGCTYTGVYVTIWRESPTVASGFDLIQVSQNLLPLTSGLTNSVNLSPPLQVAAGDLTGTLETGSATAANCGGFTLSTDNNNVIGSYITGALSTYQGLVWNGAPNSSSTSGQMPAIELYSKQSPQLVAIGDSLISGYPNNHDPCDGLAAFGGSRQPGATIGQGIAALLGWSVDDCGCSGQQTPAMLARFGSDVAANTPQWTLIEGGINDLNVSNSTAAAILSNLSAETSAAIAAKSNVVLLAILPGAYTSNALMSVRDQVNAGLASLANGSTILYVDAGPYIGVARYGGSPAPPAGNLWNTIASYDAGDHEHLNPAGYARVAQAVADAIQAHPRHN